MAPKGAISLSDAASRISLMVKFVSCRTFGGDVKRAGIFVGVVALTALGIFSLVGRTPAADPGIQVSQSTPEPSVTPEMEPTVAPSETQSLSPSPTAAPTTSPTKSKTIEPTTKVTKSQTPTPTPKLTLTPKVGTSTAWIKPTATTVAAAWTAYPAVFVKPHLGVVLLPDGILVAYITENRWQAQRFIGATRYEFLETNNEINPTDVIRIYCPNSETPFSWRVTAYTDFFHPGSVKWMPEKPFEYCGTP